MGTGKRPYAPRVPGIKCPHCGSRTIVRDSNEVTTLVRDLRIVCTDDDCGFSGVAQLSIIREVRPSAKPNRDVRLPATTWSKRPPANDDHREPANDDAQRQAEEIGIGAALANLMVT